MSKKWKRNKAINHKGQHKPERRCIVCAQSQDHVLMVRLVLHPEQQNQWVVDVARKLPGKGYWTHYECLPKLMAKAPKQMRHIAPIALEDIVRVRQGLMQRVRNLLGMSRKAGELTHGAGKMLADGPYALVFHAQEAADDSIRKLKPVTAEAEICRLMTSSDLSQALGQEHVVHVGLTASGLTAQILDEVTRLDALERGLLHEHMEDRLEQA